MDARTGKLVRLGVDPDVAALLIGEEYASPADIKDATDEELEEVIGSEALSAVRQLFAGRQEE